MTETLLVVEDDPSSLAALGEALASEHRTPVLATARDAVRHLAIGLRPDVIVIDLDLRDGAALLACLELGIEELATVVALASSPRRLLAAGAADAVLVKPLEPGRLRACVDRACGQPRGAL